jgi:hypothetical protein
MSGKRNYPAKRVAPGTPVIDRLLFWAREDENGCWIWQASKRNGYGQIRVEGRGHYAHRLSFETFVAEIPVGLELDHLCRVPACINPWHLEPVTPKVNNNRGDGNGRKTHCPEGHAYDDENTYHYAGRRYCRKCNRARAADFYRRNRARYQENRRNGQRAA